MITSAQCFLVLGTGLLSSPSALHAAPEAPAAQEMEEVLVDHVGFLLEHSARIRFSEEVLADPSSEGVLIVRGDDLVVDLGSSRLRGAASDADPDTYCGIGIRIEGARISLTGGAISGYRVGVEARGVDGLVIDGLDASNNFRQHLASTPEREDPSDWLWPHENDDEQWVKNYGAGIYVKQAKAVTVRNCVIHNGQNGLILDRVTESFIYDNDFSFLSGWGLALWRSSKNLISHNSLEFCVRGYSHGVYNRGQDSAGLLMFEQCNDNVVSLNSITHGGDGVFGFAGREALGDGPAPEDFSYKGKGCNNNMFVKNDLAYAAAHGLEMTFSFNNKIIACRFIDNGITGVWAGYTRGTVVSACIFRNNGRMAQGTERGGINIEHGKGNLIHFNRFLSNPVGVRLWWDADENLKDKPWVLANGFDCGHTALFGNTHRRDDVAVEIDGCPDVTVQLNTYTNCGADILASEAEMPTRENSIISPPKEPDFAQRGERKAIGGRPRLQGRQNIIMTEWGPYDFSCMKVVRTEDKGGADTWRVLGLAAGQEPTFELTSLGDVEVTGTSKKTRTDYRIGVQHTGTGLLSYRLEVSAGDETQVTEEQRLIADWKVQAFAAPVDPREDLESWRKSSSGGVEFETSDLNFDLGSGSLADIKRLGKIAGLSDIGSDRFGLVAKTSLNLPAGPFSIHTLSDDGIRVTVDGQVVLEDWTHHASTEHATELNFPEAGSHDLVVEWFELDGAANLNVALDRPVH